LTGDAAADNRSHDWSSLLGALARMNEPVNERTADGERHGYGSRDECHSPQRR
jgi:hypothetical protein